MSSDPTTWGLQANGWVTPTLQEIMASTGSDLLAFVDPDLDLDADAPEGQTLGVFSRQLALIWEGEQALHDGQNPDAAENDQLLDICKLTGTQFRGPRATTVVAQCTLASGTTLANGTAFATKTDHPDVLFTPVLDFTAPSDGTFNVSFACVTTGPIAISPGDLILGPAVVGWTAVGNSAAGVPGDNGDTNDSLRLRREQELTASGTSTTAALEADLQAITTVISVSALENLTDLTVDSVPPHSFECLVYESGTDPATLARTIWQGKPAGINWHGTTPVSFTDSKGVLRTVSYTPLTLVPVYLAYTLGVDATRWVGDVVFRAAIVQALTDLSKAGTDVQALRVASLAFAEPSVLAVTAYALGLAPGPTGTSDLIITSRQIATFDPAHILVTT